MSLRRAWRGGWVTALVTACWTGGGNATAPAASAPPAAPSPTTPWTALRLEPWSGAASDARTLRLTGRGLRPGLSVQLGGLEAPVQVRSDSTAQVTVPDALPPGAADVVVIQAGERQALLVPFAYLPAPTRWHFRHDMEGGTLADVGTGAGAPGGPARVEFTTERAATGARSLKFTATSGEDGVIARMERGFLSPNPAASATGVYQRFSLFIPAATFANAWPGQIKLLLNRYDGEQSEAARGWAMWGIGAQFPLDGGPADAPPTQLSVAAADWGIARLPGCVPFALPADRWFTVQLWYRHAGGVGTMRWWLDGQPAGSCSSPILGTGDPARGLALWLGIAYAQATRFPLVLYVDDVQAADGYIKP
jgi:hypothetical protein